jgi:hypothetical protein
MWFRKKKSNPHKKGNAKGNHIQIDEKIFVTFSDTFHDSTDDEEETTSNLTDDFDDAITLENDTVPRQTDDIYDKKTAQTETSKQSPDPDKTKVFLDGTENTEDTKVSPEISHEQPDPDETILLNDHGVPQNLSPVENQGTNKQEHPRETEPDISTQDTVFLKPTEQEKHQEEEPIQNQIISKSPEAIEENTRYVRILAAPDQTSYIGEKKEERTEQLMKEDLQPPAAGRFRRITKGVRLLFLFNLLALFFTIAYWGFLGEQQIVLHVVPQDSRIEIFPEDETQKISLPYSLKPVSISLKPGTYRIRISKEENGFIPIERDLVIGFLRNRWQTPVESFILRKQIRFETKPESAFVLYGQQKKELSPCEYELPVGRHMVEIQKPGFEPEQLDVWVDSQTEEIITTHLKKQVTVRTAPEHTMISVHGEAHESPADFFLYHGNNKILLFHEGFHLVQLAIDVDDLGRWEIITSDQCSVQADPQKDALVLSLYKSILLHSTPDNVEVYGADDDLLGHTSMEFLAQANETYQFSFVKDGYHTVKHKVFIDENIKNLPVRLESR